MLFIALLSLILLKAPFTIIQSNIVVRFLCFAPFCLYILIGLTNLYLSSAKRRKSKYNRIHSKLFSAFLIFLFLLIFAYLRSSGAGILSNIKLLSRIFELLTVSTFLFILFYKNRSIKIPFFNKISNLNVIYNSLGLYVSTNVFLSFFVSTSARAIKTYGSDSFGEAEILSWLGINATRNLFPIAPGFNAYGSISGVALTASLVDLFFCIKNKKSILKSVIFIAASFYSLSICDTRGALLSSLLALVIIYTANHFRKISYLKYFSFVPTIVLVFLMGILGVINTLDLSSFARSSGDILTGRGNLWVSAIEKLSQPELQHMVGYGMHGQAISGLSQAYARQFEALLGSNAEFASLHNSNLQYIFDLGYIGLLFYIFIIFAAISFYAKQISKFDHRILAHDYYVNLSMLIFFMLIGLFEIMPTVHALDNFFVFLGLILPMIFQVPNQGPGLQMAPMDNRAIATSSKVKHGQA